MKQILWILVAVLIFSCKQQTNESTKTAAEVPPAIVIDSIKIKNSIKLVEIRKIKNYYRSKLDSIKTIFFQMENEFDSLGLSFLKMEDKFLNIDDLDSRSSILRRLLKTQAKMVQIQENLKKVHIYTERKEKELSDAIKEIESTMK